MTRHKSDPAPTPGWAVYLRTSTEDAQNPDNSHRRQITRIQEALLKTSSLPVIQQYVDNSSGRTISRKQYQRMLADAHAGKFSHVAVENAERFGRNDTEALRAIDELHRLGIAVRFADYPDLDPMDADDRVMVSLSFTLARRESMLLGKRTSGGQKAKLDKGGWAWRAPDGFMNCERRTDSLDKLDHGRYSRWVEQDPQRAHIWREAWDLLLEDRYTLKNICHELHNRGYTLRSGKPLVWTDPDGTTHEARNILSRIFKNWFYAGWVVNPAKNIPPKTIRGEWEPIVSTEEFERGLEILNKRTTHRKPHHKHDYLLKGLVYVQVPGKKRPYRLTGSTPNVRRKKGVISYYCIEKKSIHIQCAVIDEQMPHLLARIQVDPQLLPVIRQCYLDEVAQKLGHHEPNQRDKVEAALAAIMNEEERALRLYTAGKISEAVWERLWQDWQSRRTHLRASLSAIDRDDALHIRNLDDALAWISKLAILYGKQPRKNQRALLELIVEKLVVDPDGKVVSCLLRPPFAYIQSIHQRIVGDEQGTHEGLKAEKAGHMTSLPTETFCSSYVSFGDPNGT